MSLLEPTDVILLTVNDLSAAAVWYRQKLDCYAVPGEDDELTRVFQFGDGQPCLVLGLHKPGEPEPGLQEVVPVFYTKKISKAHDELSRRGIPVGPIQHDGGGTPFFELRDPDGNRMEVCEEH